MNKKYTLIDKIILNSCYTVGSSPYFADNTDLMAKFEKYEKRNRVIKKLLAENLDK